MLLHGKWGDPTQSIKTADSPQEIAQMSYKTLTAPSGVESSVGHSGDLNGQDRLVTVMPSLQGESGWDLSLERCWEVEEGMG